MTLGKVYQFSQSLIRLKDFSTPTNYDVLVIDFYNVYCKMISFRRTKTFTEESFVNCFETIAMLLPNKPKIIVSKIIFEVPESTILYLTKRYKNCTYILVTDLFVEKGFNRERDDFVCLATLAYFSKTRIKPLFISNDQLNNYEEIVKNIKKFSIKIFDEGSSSVTIFNPECIVHFVDTLLRNKKNIRRTNFFFMPRVPKSVKSQ